MSLIFLDLGKDTISSSHLLKQVKTEKNLERFLR